MPMLLSYVNVLEKWAPVFFSTSALKPSSFKSLKVRSRRPFDRQTIVLTNTSHLQKIAQIQTPPVLLVVASNSFSDTQETNEVDIKREPSCFVRKPGLRPHSFGRVRGGKGCRGPVKEIQQRLSRRECWWLRCQNSGRASELVEDRRFAAGRMAMTGPVIAKQRREGTPHGTSAKDSAIGIWMQLGRLVRGFWGCENGKR